MGQDPDLRRAYEFIARGDMAGTRVEPFRFGIAVSDDRVPRRYDSNYLLIDELPASVGAAELAAEADRLGRAALMARDEAAAWRLEAGFARLGWRVQRFLVMAHRRETRRLVDTGLVQEVDEAALRPARRRLLAGEPWATPEVVEQLFEAKLRVAPGVRTRFFAVIAGVEAASWADLYLDGRTAQVEDVATRPEHRGRGFASAVVLRAVEEARMAGCELVFLVALEDDWPRELYRRLGFDGLGRFTKFLRLP
jgi:ribosomal protein S18 acetylase RimI-like enzyme